MKKIGKTMIHTMIAVVLGLMPGLASQAAA